MKCSRVIVLVFFAIATFCAFGDAAKILGIFTTSSKSHLIIHMSVARTLVAKGHNVTVVTSQPLSDSGKGYRHIQVDAPGPSKEMMANMLDKSGGVLSGIINGRKMMDFFMDHPNISLNDPQMKKLMDEESFDLVMVGYFVTDIQYGVAAHFKCPLVVIFMNRPSKTLNNMIGSPNEMLYVPHVMSAIHQPMRFFDRLKNIFSYGVEIAFFWYLESQLQTRYQYNFPPEKYPSLDEMRKNVSLILSCYHFSTGPIKPSVPALVDIGGIQVKPKPDPLPKDLKKFIDEAKDGVIFFSMGSNARSADLNPDMITNVYSVLSSLKQRVVWKWEEDKTPGKAENIFFGKWLPQDDILAHPNVKLFVTHGGHGSVVESEYHGVPMVGIPLFADQFANMDSVENSGYGITLGKQSLTAEAFREALMEVLTNPKYRDNVQSFSKLYRDRPMSARDTAAFWIEYVIRHRGAKHMQSPAVHMSTIEYYGLDIMAFLLVVGYIIVKVVKITFRFLISLCCGKKGKKQEDERKNKTKKIQ